MAINPGISTPTKILGPVISHFDFKIFRIFGYFYLDIFHHCTNSMLMIPFQCFQRSLGKAKPRRVLLGWKDYRMAVTSVTPTHHHLEADSVSGIVAILWTRFSLPIWIELQHKPPSNLLGTATTCPRDPFLALLITFTLLSSILCRNLKSLS